MIVGYLMPRTGKLVTLHSVERCDLEPQWLYTPAFSVIFFDFLLNTAYLPIDKQGFNIHHNHESLYKKDV